MGANSNVLFTLIPLVIIAGVIIFIFLKPDSNKASKAAELINSNKTDIKDEYQVKLNDIINKLRGAGYSIEYRSNFAVKGFVLLRSNEDKEDLFLISLDNLNNLLIKVVVPTSVSIGYGLAITVVCSILISLLTKNIVIFGILFLLLSTYLVDADYKRRRKSLTNNLLFELNNVISQNKPL